MEGISGEHATASASLDSIPPPPISLSVPDQHPTLTSSLPGGAQICAGERLDLSRVIIRFDLNSELSPEEFRLLSTWLQLATERLTAEVPVDWDGDLCAGALLCATTAPRYGQKLIAALSQAVSDPPLSALFSARNTALSQARTMDAESIEWRLDVGSAALRQPGTYLEKALEQRNEQPSQDEAADKLLERVLAGLMGGSRLSALRNDFVVQRLREELPRLRVTIAGVLSSQAALDAFSKGWRGAPTSSKAELGKTESRQALSPMTLVRLGENAVEWTHAKLSWWNVEARNVTWVGIRVIAERLRRRTPSEVLLSTTSSHRFDSPLGLNIEGPYDQVVETTLAAEDEYQRLISLSGAPNTTEIKQAFVALTIEQSKTLEPRCWPIAPSAASAGEITQALRGSGPPIKILWGFPHVPDLDESP
jgi:hypothetical protein